ncbi:unnamed protein product [Laminaria digitata]
MAADPVGTLEDVFEFMGMDFIDENEKTASLWEKAVRQNHNLTDEKKKQFLAQQASFFVTPEILESLREFFAPHNARLQELLGRPLPDGWTTSPTPDE